MEDPWRMEEVPWKMSEDQLEAEEVAIWLKKGSRKCLDKFKQNTSKSQNKTTNLQSSKYLCLSIVSKRICCVTGFFILSMTPMAVL